MPVRPHFYFKISSTLLAWHIMGIFDSRVDWGITVHLSFAWKNAFKIFHLLLTLFPHQNFFSSATIFTQQFLAHNSEQLHGIVSLMRAINSCLLIAIWLCDDTVILLLIYELDLVLFELLNLMKILIKIGSSFSSSILCIFFMFFSLKVFSN